jgi:hypothetical protein
MHHRLICHIQRVIIYEFYEILETDEDSTCQAKCKQCGKIVFIIKGSLVTSSYTSGLTSHFQNHPETYEEFLDKLKNTIVPDNKSLFNHFQAREKGVLLYLANLIQADGWKKAKETLY